MTFTKSFGMKLVAVSMLMMLMFTICTVPSPVEAHFQKSPDAWRGNYTAQTGWLEMFNYTFEDDPVGSYNMADYGELPSVNWSLGTIYEPGDHNKVLCFNQSGATTQGYAGGFYTGHQFDSVFKISVDFCFKYWNTIPGAVDISLGIGNTWLGAQSHQPIIWFGKDSNNVYMSALGKTTYINNKAWHTIELVVNLNNQTAISYLDGAFVKFLPFTTTYHDSLGWFRLINTGKNYDRHMEVCLDNIAISIPYHELQALPNTDSKPSISIMFDDTLKNTYMIAKPILDPFPAATAIETSAVGGASQMTWDEIIDLNNNGWEIMSHSVNHPDMTSLDHAGMVKEFHDSKAAILTNTSIDVKGWVYPCESSSLITDQVGWNYYEYLAATDYDLKRERIYAVNEREQYYLDRFNVGCLYSKYAHISVYTHSIVDDGSITGYDTNTTAFTNWVNWLKTNNIDVVTPYDGYIKYRNFAMSIISNTANGFIIDYPDDYCNFANGDVYIQIPGNYTDGEYVAISNGDVIDSGYADNGVLTLLLYSGTYEIMLLSDYRSMKMQEAFSPIFAIIPLVIIVSVIPMVMGLGRKLK